MRFGPVAPGDAVGAVLAHGLSAGGRRLAKGTALTPGDVEDLEAAGHETVVVARLDEDDVPENEAARVLAEAAGGPGTRVRGPFTGRANLLADVAGLAVVDEAAVGRANAVSEVLTLATLRSHRRVGAGALVATAKVIPLAVPGVLLERAAGVLRRAAPVVRVAPFRPHRAGLVLTELPGTSHKLLARSEEVLRERLEALGSTLDQVQTVPHRTGSVAASLMELGGAGLSPLLVLGASAVVDRADVVPRAVEEAGGKVHRLGMPVDPGNLLLLAWLGGAPVVGVPGCARSPKRNGFDLVLERLLAGVPPLPADMAAMGVGGLMAEIPSRTQPREGPPARTGEPTPERRSRVAGVVLAAGLSRRMAGADKLLARIGGETLVGRAVDTALDAGLSPVVVVTGRGSDAVRSALAGREVRFAHNPDPARGIASSLAAGVEALADDDVAGAAILLGDMPRVRPGTVRALVDALAPGEGRSVCVPVHHGKRGNPVLWAAALLPELGRLDGDTGGRALLGRYAEEVHEVEVDDPGVLLDVDTPEALGEAGGVLPP